MPPVFLDTSAFVKLYIVESGSGTIGDLVREAESVVVSAVILPESLSALCRLMREGKLETVDYEQLKERLFGDIARLLVVPVSDEVIRHAITAIEHSPIRTLDALHIGSALAAEASLFVSSDSRQVNAARKTGLSVRFIE